MGNAQCSGLLQCINACQQGDQACADSCVQRYQAGVTPLQNAISCVNQSCGNACQ
jgi:hypothetical protein